LKKPKPLKGVTPIGDGILVQCDDAEKIETALPGGKILKPETVLEAENKKVPAGWVVAVGPGRYDPFSGKRVPMQVKLGDRVTIKRNCGYVFKYRGVEYMCMSGEHEIVLVEK
jgi:co-chaperonin GroES (HSP10)